MYVQPAGAFIQINCQNCSVSTSRIILWGLCCTHVAKKRSQIEASSSGPLGKKRCNMTHMTNKPIPKLRKAPQPPLSHPGAIPDSERAKKPALSEPYVTDQELNPGDRVEGLGNFGKPTGELGTVEQTNEEDALVKWDDDGRVRRHQPSLKKVKLAGQVE